MQKEQISLSEMIKKCLIQRDMSKKSFSGSGCSVWYS